MSNRHHKVFLAACCLAFATPTAPARAQGRAVTEEYRLKAAFVYRFPEFVEWPAASWTGRDSLEICVSEPNPFGAALAELVTGESVNGRPVMVRQVHSDAPIASCHLLFVASGTPRRADLVRRAGTMPILTVGDTPRFLDEGGIISLRLVKRRVRFEVNTAAAERVGLRVSSQLLRLATAVRSRG